MIELAKTAMMRSAFLGLGGVLVLTFFTLPACQRGASNNTAQHCLSTTVEGSYNVVRNKCSGIINTIVCVNHLGRSGLGLCERKRINSGGTIVTMAADHANIFQKAVSPSSFHIFSCKDGYLPINNEGNVETTLQYECEATGK